MRILLVEPFFSGSHASWAEGFRKHSGHDVEILSLPGRHWKWRMHGGAVALAQQFKSGSFQPDLVLTTDMLDVSSFIGLCGTALHGVPLAVYFHENQLSYPWSPQDEDVRKGRDFHYGFINWTSVLASDRIYFNSEYNLKSFYAGVETMLKIMPDARGLELIEPSRNRSEVLSLGIDLKADHEDNMQTDLSKPVILWNHRWEYDKDPDAFFAEIRHLKDKGIDFDLIVCGESYGQYPDIFNKAEKEFSKELIHFGYARSRQEYLGLLAKANILPVTSNQEFFGQSVMEAIAAGCLPIMPNALVYPEHVPDSLQSHLLYADSVQLRERLVNVCHNLQNVKPFIDTMQKVAMQYDWSAMSSVYDRKFESLVSL